MTGQQTAGRPSRPPAYADLPAGWSLHHVTGTWMLPRIAVRRRASGFFAVSVGMFRHAWTAIRKPAGPGPDADREPQP